jgi:hypothetical protein
MVSTATKIDERNLVTLLLAYALLDLFDQHQFDSSYFRFEITIAMVNMAMVGYFLPNLWSSAMSSNPTQTIDQR